MTTIYKYPLEIAHEQTVTIPVGFQIAHVGLDPRGTPSLWAIVNTSHGVIDETVHIVGTGHPVPPNVHRHIGSFVQHEFVWHVFLG